MNIKLKKAVEDLNQNLSRTILVVFALVLGIWGAGSILVSYVILQNDLRENFIRTMPPHAILISPNFDKLNLDSFRRRPDIESAEFRDLSFQRIEVYPAVWIPLWIFGVEDFNHFEIAGIYHTSGNKIPSPGSILVERNGLMVSQLKAGSAANVRVGSRTLSVPVSGICFDPAQAPATQDAFIYSYTDKKTYAAITGEPINQRLILRLKNVRTTKEVQAATNTIVAEFRLAGITLISVKVPKINEHPHQWQLNILLLLEGSIGLLALIMAAVLVSQLMAAILARQVRQIGIMKAVGASSFQVFQIYGAMILVLGIAAGLLAVPLAIWSGKAFAHFVAVKLNFDILTKSLPVYMYLLLVAASIILPFLLSLPAILKGLRLPVQKSINDYGINEVHTNNELLINIGSLLPFSFVLALRNSNWRKRPLVTFSLKRPLHFCDKPHNRFINK